VAQTRVSVKCEKQKSRSGMHKGGKNTGQSVAVAVAVNSRVRRSSKKRVCDTKVERKKRLTTWNEKSVGWTKQARVDERRK